MEYVEFKDKWGDYLDEMIVKLLRKKGYEKFGLIFEVDESEDNPPGTHGPNLFTLVEPSGKARFGINHWDWNETAPDGSKGYYRLDLERYWGEGHIKEERDRNPRFLRALREAGLPLTEEEKKRLDDYLSGAVR